MKLLQMIILYAGINDLRNLLLLNLKSYNHKSSLFLLHLIYYLDSYNKIYLRQSLFFILINFFECAKQISIKSQ